MRMRVVAAAPTSYDSLSAAFVHPVQGSGVIAVVVFGLWGNYTSKWGMLASTEDSGAFDACELCCCGLLPAVANMCLLSWILNWLEHLPSAWAAACCSLGDPFFCLQRPRVLLDRHCFSQLLYPVSVLLQLMSCVL
jgi:hypothetical protein